MTEIDVQWDEDRGGPRDHRALISSPSDGALVRATRKALPWTDCGPHDEGRMTLPYMFVEKLLRKAPVPEPRSLHAHCFIDKCLSLEDFVVPALELLVEQDFLVDESASVETQTLVTRVRV